MKLAKRRACHLSLVVDDIDLTRRGDDCYPEFPNAYKRELESACVSLPICVHRLGFEFSCET